MCMFIGNVNIPLMFNRDNFKNNLCIIYNYTSVLKLYVMYGN